MFILLIIVLYKRNIFHCEFVKFSKNLNFVIGFGLMLILTILERWKYHFDKKYN